MMTSQTTNNNNLAEYFRNSNLTQENNNFAKTGPNSRTSKKKWSDVEDRKLIQLAEGTSGRRWKWIASQIPGKNDTQCRSRYERIKPGMKQGRWTNDEDELLAKLYRIHGDKWSEIAKLMKDRTGKQVRDRIKNVLDPNVNKAEFTQSESDLLYRLYEQVGPKWKDIRDSDFPDRSVDFIKNHFYSIHRRKTKKCLRAKFRILKKKKISKIIIPIDEKCLIANGKNSEIPSMENNNQQSNSTMKTSFGKFFFDFSKIRSRGI